MGCLVGSTQVSPFFLLFCCNLRSTGPCQSVLHLAKLTRLLGSPETWHLADLLTVSPPQITPSLSALTTPLNLFLPSLLSSPCFFTSYFLFICALCLSLALFIFPVGLPFPSPQFLVTYLFLPFFISFFPFFKSLL